MKQLKNITKAVFLLQEKMLLHEWEIRIQTYKFSRKNSSKHTLADVQLYLNQRVAIITCDKTMLGKHKTLSNYEWFKAIIHEMLHIRLANTTEGIVRRTRKIHKNHELFYNEFIMEFEPEVELLARFIYEQWQGWPKEK